MILKLLLFSSYAAYFNPSQPVFTLSIFDVTTISLLCKKGS